jgi:predicted naringenin-chalcone synthase
MHGSALYLWYVYKLLIDYGNVYKRTSKAASLDTSPVYIHAIATCVPEHSYTQEFTLDFLLTLQGTTERKRDFLTKIYQGSAIHKRHTVIDDYGKDPADYTFYPQSPDLKPEPSTAVRNDLYIKEADRLSLQAVQALLDKLPGLDKGAITHLITVSCTGFSAPGFDVHLVKKLGLAPSVNRLHIGFMGCYAAFPALRTARDICLADPGAGVIIVNLELCSRRMFRPGGRMPLLL